MSALTHQPATQRPLALQPYRGIRGECLRSNSLREGSLNIRPNLGLQPTSRLLTQVKLNWPTTNLTIFNIVQTHVFGVQEHLYGLSAVRAINTAFL